MSSWTVSVQQCNAACGNGTQRRDVICVKKTGSDFTVTSARECLHLEKPSPIQPCELQPCKPQWFTTEWSSVRMTLPEHDVRIMFPQHLLSFWHHSLFLPVFSILRQWQADSRGTLSDGGQTAKPSLQPRIQTCTRTILQHNTLQPLWRCVCVFKWLRGKI